jgi:hypothetical protein
LNYLTVVNSLLCFQDIPNTHLDLLDQKKINLEKDLKIIFIYLSFDSLIFFKDAWQNQNR